MWSPIFVHILAVRSYCWQSDLPFVKRNKQAKHPNKRNQQQGDPHPTCFKIKEKEPSLLWHFLAALRCSVCSFPVVKVLFWQGKSFQVDRKIERMIQNCSLAKVWQTVFFPPSCHWHNTISISSVSHSFLFFECSVIVMLNKYSYPTLHFEQLYPDNWFQMLNPEVLPAGGILIISSS